MADTIKVLAQSLPAANTLTNVYTAAAPAAIISVAFCNQSPDPATFSLAVAVAGAADTAAQYAYKERTVPGKQTFIATVGVTLATTDVLRVQTSNGQTSV